MRGCWLDLLAVVVFLFCFSWGGFVGYKIGEHFDGSGIVAGLGAFLGCISGAIASVLILNAIWRELGEK